MALSEHGLYQIDPCIDDQFCFLKSHALFMEPMFCKTQVSTALTFKYKSDMYTLDTLELERNWLLVSFTWLEGLYLQSVQYIRQHSIQSWQLFIPSEIVLVISTPSPVTALLLCNPQNL
jgi:hypothetical protein